MRNTFVSLAAVAASMVLASSAGFAAELIQDGGFETPSIGATWYQTFTTPFPGSLGPWVPTNVDIVSALGAPGNAPAYEGVQYLDLVGTGPDGTQLSTGEIYQTFSTVAGKTYRLSFAYGNNPWSTSTASAAVLVGNGALDGTDLTTSVTHDTSSTSNIDWSTFAATFVATSSLTTLTFNETVGANNGGVLLDAVSVSVPEPSTWAMLIVGFASLGFAGWRRARVVAVSV